MTTPAHLILPRERVIVALDVPDCGTLATLLDRLDGLPVFYKVGHHGSHNATLKQNGLELMTSPDLSAFIPTNEVDAKKVGWGEMPFEPLLDDLRKRTSQRVVRADDPWLKQAPDPANLAKGSIKHVSHDPSGLWVEFEIA